MQEWIANNLGVIITILLSGVSLIAWFMRLESNTKRNHDDIRDLEKAHTDFKTDIVNMQNSLGEMREIKTDIRWIKEGLQKLVDKAN